MASPAATLPSSLPASLPTIPSLYSLLMPALIVITEASPSDSWGVGKEIHSQILGRALGP